MNHVCNPDPKDGASRSCHFWSSLLLLSSLWIAGCRTDNVNSPTAFHPEKYSRVAVLPICIAGPFSSDFSLVDGDSQAKLRQTGVQLARALTNQLVSKGYQVVGPVSTVCEEEGWAAFDPAASWILRQQFELELIRTDRGETNALYSCGFLSNLPVVQEKLGLPEADAVVLLERSTGYHSPDVDRKGLWWKIPVATTLGVFVLAGAVAAYPETVLDAGSANSNPPEPNSIDYSVYIFDFHTQEIIFNRCQTFQYRTPAGAVRILLKPLPERVPTTLNSQQPNLETPPGE